MEIDIQPVVSPPENTDVQKPGDIAPAPVAAPEGITLTRAEYEQMRSDNDKSKGYVVALTQQLSALMERERREPEMPPQERQQAVKQLLDDDPETALDAHFRERIAPIMQNNDRTIAAINKDRAMEKIGKAGWERWGAKVEEFMGPMDATTKAQPGAWEEAYNYVRLKDIDKIIEEGVRAKLAEQQRGSLLEGSSSSAASATNGQRRQLGSLEKSIAAEFGMTDEEWIKYGSADMVREEN